MFEHLAAKTLAPTAEAKTSKSPVGQPARVIETTSGAACAADRRTTDFSRVPVTPAGTTGPRSAGRPPERGAPRIQAKLRVSTPDEPAERAADRLAEQVLAADEGPLDFGEPGVAAGPADGPADPVMPGGQDSGGQNAAWWDEVHRAAVEAPPTATARRRRAEPAGSPMDPFQCRLATRVGRGATLPADTLSETQRLFRADFAEVRVHTDHQAAALNDDLRAHAFTYGHDIFFGSGQYDPASRHGRRLLAHELAHVVQQGRAATDPAADGRIDRQPKGAAQSIAVTINVTVDQPVTGPEFFTRAVMQYLATSREEATKKIKEGKFTCSHEACIYGVSQDQVGTPIAVAVSAPGMSGAEKTATTKRTAAIAALPAGERKDLNDEVDRRFWNKFEYRRGQPLKPGATEEGMRQVWLRTREGVLGDQQNVAKIEPRIQAFLTADGTRKIAPAEYRTALRLATKLETFSDTDWQLYRRRVNASTDDFEILERSIDSFKAQQAAEKNVRDRIAGKENLYQQVKDFQAVDKQVHTPIGRGGIMQIDLPGIREKFTAQREQLDTALKAQGFNTVAEFEQAKTDFLNLFRKRAVEITLLVLRASERAVATERKRYDDPNEVAALQAQLGPMRAALTESYRAGRASMPTPMQLKSDSLESTPMQKAALARSVERAQFATTERNAAAKQHPMLLDPKLSSDALNVDSAVELQEALRRNADNRQKSIVHTRVSVLDDNDKVFKLDRIVELTRQELSVSPQSIYDLVIEDYRRQLESDAFWTGIAVGALALGLGIVSFGTGTVAVLAGAGALALGAYQAGEEYNKYEEGQAAAHTNFDTALSVSSDEPSAVWVAVALMGVGLDGLALANAFKAALPAARLLKEAGGAARFEAELAKATELTEAMRAAVSRAQKANAEYLTALDELAEARVAAKGRLHSGPDSEVVNKMVKTAYYAIKNKVADFEVFMRQLKLQKLAKGIDLSKLTPEEEAAWRAAFETAKTQVAADTARFSVSVTYKSGQKIVTFDETGKILLDGKKITGADYKEIYKNLDLTHVVTGHGPQKPLIEVMNEAKNSAVGLSGRFTSDARLLQAVARARAEFQTTGKLQIFLDALPNDGRTFAKASKVRSGAQTMLPFDAPPGVVEIQVKHIQAIFRPDGTIVTIFPVGF